MPVSKKRKRKNGSVAKFKNDRYEMRRRQIERDIADGEMTSGVSLQDLINMVAYQEHQAAGLVEGPVIPDSAEPEHDPEVPDLSTPEAEAVINAVHKVTTEEENEDGR